MQAAAGRLRRQAGCDRVCHPKVKQVAHDPIMAFNRWIGNAPAEPAHYAEVTQSKAAVAN